MVAPGDPVEAALATQAIAEWAEPCYLRLVKTGDPIVHQTTPDFRIGKATKLREGRDVTLIATGGMLYNTVQAAEQLAQQGFQSRVLGMHTIKPLDTEAVLSAAAETSVIVTIEEHSIIGGLGGAVAELLAELGDSHIKFKRIGLNDSFCSQVGSQEYLRKTHSLSIEGVVSTVICLLKSCEMAEKQIEF